MVEAVDGRPVREWSDLASAVAEHPGPLALTIRRGDQVLEVRATPRPDEEGVPRLGVAQLYAYRKLSLGEAAGYAFRHASALAADGLRATWAMVRGKGGATLQGPVGIAQRTAAASTSGADVLVALLAAISVALAVFNLLPVPGLDGGKLLLLGIAAVRGKPTDPRVEAVTNAAGFLALIALAVWVTVHDVRGARAPETVPDAGAPPAAGMPVDAGTSGDAGAMERGAADAGAVDAGAALDAGAGADR
jgi:regulator of sigma E protease